MCPHPHAHFLPPPFSLRGAPSSREGTLRPSHHAVPGAPQGEHIPEPVLERGHETDTRRYTSGVGLAHQVIAAGDGQGERGVAAPQRAGVGSVGQQEPDDIPGTLGRREAGRRVTGARPLQGKLTQRAVSLATDCSSLVLGPCLAHQVPWTLGSEWWVDPQAEKRLSKRRSFKMENRDVGDE